MESPHTKASPGFHGPYADFPPPNALVVDAPPLDALSFATARRLVATAVILVICVLARLARRLRGVLTGQSAQSWADASAAGAVDAFERLGPTWVKIGQLIASSPGVFPAPLASACQRTLDSVPPFSASVARQIIREDLGRDVSELFATFDDQPLAAASVGQVHACTLHNGRAAVVKLQRPGIRGIFTADLQILYRLARLGERFQRLKAANLVEVVRDLHTVSFQEMNPALEAKRQHDFRTNIGAFGDNLAVTAPEIYWDYCGPRMICMERMSGIRMDDIDEMKRRGIDGALQLRRGAKVWIEAVCVHGPFHGDVHAGNLWVLDDERCSYLDFGIMGELSAPYRQLLKDLLYTTMIDGDFTRVAAAMRAVGIISADLGTDDELGGRLQMILGPLLADGMSGLNLSEFLTMSVSFMGDYETQLPREMLLILKQLAYIERYAKSLAPDYVLVKDLYMLKNVYPAEVAAALIERGIDLPA